jgi:hypothetical protein
MRGDLLGAALCRDVLGLRQLRSSTRASAVARKGDEIFGHHGDGASRTLLPRGVGR